MKVSEYLKTARLTDRLPTGDPACDINPRLGLAGETGYLLTVLKKEIREDAPTAEATLLEVADELGDMIWYASTIASRANINFVEDVLFNNIVRVQSNYTDKNLAPAPLLTDLLAPGGEIENAIGQGSECVSTFAKYQKLAAKASRYAHDKSTLVPYLVQIWHNVGDLLLPFGVEGYSNAVPAHSRNQIAKSLGDVMWYIAGFAELYGLSLDKIVEENELKILSAFPPKDQKERTPLFDDGLSFLEQLPRDFSVDFVQQNDETSVMLINDVRVGDPLTDNAYGEVDGKKHLIGIEGYRYHDAVHLAFVGILGWSPVMRSLLKRKRKSLKLVDEVEDGARAQIVEEMIVKISHSYAVGHDANTLLNNKKHVNLNLLKQIVGLAEGLEVAGGRQGFQGCKFWEWQEAILKGFQVYNDLRKNHGGRILVSLETRNVSFRPH